jgi:translocation and assembly module TamA
MKRFVWCMVLCAVPLFSLAQPAAFNVRFDAPEAVRPFLERHLELQQYRAVADLTDAELSRLALLAKTQATELLATLGYFASDVRIDVASQPDSTTVREVVITVIPGAQTLVSGVHILFTGAIATNPRSADQKQLIEGSWNLPVGMPFSQSQWDSAKEQVVKKMTSQRFPAGHIVSAQADVDPDTESADLSITLDSGPLYQIGVVHVQGATRYGEDVVLRLARLKPGAEYLQSDLVEAQQRLTDSGYFDSAYLTLDQTSDPEKSVVNAVVREASMQKLVFGVGASTDTGARFSVEHTDNQVPGIDWRVVNKLTVDRDTSSFSSDWTSKPDEAQWRWEVSALLDTQTVGETDVTGQRYRGGRFLLGKELDQSYYLQFDRADTHSRDTDISVSNEALSANYAFTWRQFDSMPFPGDGWAIGGEFAVGSTLGPLPEPFGRVLMRWQDFLPLGSATQTAFERQLAGRLSLRAEAGTVVVADPSAIPFTQLFLAGGDNSVRGYKWQSIGVTQNGQLTADPGRYLASGSVEWQRPIVLGGVMSQWESDVFMDGGAVANEPSALDMKLGIGAGVRYKSPIGPLQLDLAYGVAVQQFMLHFSVGFVF